MLPQTPPRSPRRPYWVLAVAGAYALILAGLLVLPWFVVNSGDTSQIVAIFTVLWLFLLAGLMFVPIQIRRRRPMTRGTIWVPLLFTGLLAGVLALAVGMALWELWKINLDSLWPLLAAGAGVWALWAALFYLLTRAKGRMPVALALHHWLFAGSLAELLIAVSCHIVVRRRPECCAGMMTGAAIAMGVLVLILALGPGVAILYVRRWRQIQPVDETRGFEVTLNPPADANSPAA